MPYGGGFRWDKIQEGTRVEIANIEEKTHVIQFTGSPRHTVGVELEISLVDPETRALVPLAGDVLATLGEDGCFKPELFQTIVEINSDVCENVAQIRADLSGKVDILRKVGDEQGFQIMCTGTHPFSRPRDLPITDKERYQHLVNSMRWPAQRLLICGQHVHVGVPSGEHAIAVMNAIRCFIPHLLALSASSPFWKRGDTGLASSRIKIFEGLPTAGLPPRLTNWNEFTTLMGTLVESGTITSIREIWWDIRPHPVFGTLEIRICDAINNMTEICAITALVQCLVAHFTKLYDAGEILPSFKRWTIRENKWRAARHGDEMLFIRNERGEQMPIHDHIQQTVERLAPTATELGCANELKQVMDILDRRPNYIRQLKRYEATKSYESVVDGLVEEFRTDVPMSS